MLLWVTDVVFAAVPVAFLVGLLRTRLQRSGVADLVVELGSLPPPGRVRDAIAHALGDRSLELGFWLPAEHRYVDADGHALDPRPGPGRAVTVLEPGGERLAVLVHDPSLLEEPELVEAVGCGGESGAGELALAGGAARAAGGGARVACADRGGR